MGVSHLKILSLFCFTMVGKWYSTPPSPPFPNLTPYLKKYVIYPPPHIHICHSCPHPYLALHSYHPPTPFTLPQLCPYWLGRRCPGFHLTNSSTGLESSAPHPLQVLVTPPSRGKSRISPRQLFFSKSISLQEEGGEEPMFNVKLNESKQNKSRLWTQRILTE